MAAAARAAKLRVHLDGARLWHAAVALGVPPGALTVGADTVQVCLSKGLGAPVGSLVAGSAEFVEEARRLRKMLGGGVRQGGVLAAAGLVALDRIDRLAEDHEQGPHAGRGPARARLAGGDPADQHRAGHGGRPGGHAAPVRATPGCAPAPMAGQVRLMTHADLSDADITAALDRIGPATTGGRRRSAVPVPLRRVALQCVQPGVDRPQLGQHRGQLHLGRARRPRPPPRPPRPPASSARRRFSTNQLAIDAVTTPSSAIPATISAAATSRPSTVTG